MALSARQRDFVASAYAAARAAGLSGVQADLAVSQAIHESAWGTRPSGTNNVHGIKGKGSTVQTHEIVGGKRQNIRASFRNFGSLTDSFRAWKSLMERKFSAVMKADTLAEAVRGLKAGEQGGYATDPKYDNKVKAIANTVTRVPLPPPSLVAGLGSVPLPSTAPLMGRFAQAPIPSNLPSVARPDNFAAGGPSFPRQVMTARAPLQTPSPERFGGRGAGSTSAPIMAGFAPDPSRFGRTPMAPAPSRDRVGTGAFTSQAAPAPRMASPERFAGSPPIPAPNPVNAIAGARMAPSSAIDPARLGQIAMGPAPVDRSVVPSNPGQLGGITMSNPVGLGGPGGLMVSPTPPVVPVEPLPMVPAAPPLPAPTMVRDLPVHQVEAGAPPMVPQAPRVSAMDVWRGAPGQAMSNGNTVEGDPFGNVAVTNKYGATTINLPDGSQAAGSLFAGQPSPMIPGPLGFAPDKPQGFGKMAGGAFVGARAGSAFGLPGLAIGGLLGGLVGRELSKPGGGAIGHALGFGGNQSNLPAAAPISKSSFPKAPSGGGYRGSASFSNRSMRDMQDISPAAADAISRGLGGLY